jgi:hypothetical protein
LQRLGIIPQKPQSTPAPGVQGQDSWDAGWPTGEETPQPPQVDNNTILRGFEQLESKILAETKKTARENMEEIMQEQREKDAVKTEREKRISDFVQRASGARLAVLQQNLPLVAEEKLREIVDLEKVRDSLQATSRQAVTEGDDDTAEMAYIEAGARGSEAMTALNTAHQEQATLQTAADLEGEIEMISAGGPPDARLDYEKPTYNPKEAESRREARRNKARSLEVARQKLEAR